MSYIQDMQTSDSTANLTRQLGNALRTERKRLRMTQVELAQKAGMGRQKMIQLEQGKPGVALAAYVAAVDALGLVPGIKPAEVRVADYPQLKRVTWHRPDAEMVAERDALALYERHWDLIDHEQMTVHERTWVQYLADKYGHGVLHV